MLKEIIIRELVWLVIILLVSIPLAQFTDQLLHADLTTQAVTDLQADFNKLANNYLKISNKHNDFLYFIYFWMVVGGYIARLSASGANMLIIKMPEDF